MSRDTLFLLASEFDDPALPGRAFYCKDCITIEGLLAAFPDRAANLEVVHVAYPRPRAAVIEAIGEANQNLPALVWDGGFANEIEALLGALHTRHGFPERHP
ncbi:DUF3088 family protein [Sphingomonas sp. HF-S4]|uniref:DUF3088 family protein n=1 Tax=Sphingomonas agrestis TaxID=3080540 RepID=A0ABU3Y590_9SPHN|nr:DUF3088 family protein [Sphingomonas sp. HF-S4]MDV3456574.1 DUF3088 family protein [Sphingomonas sp. HF-S4]